ncbi:D-alanyl-D-alanine carboxypeptidase family protein [Chitinimonas lacunae]|uniref:serine-type D-Ala-D-Ala carboxypeptidase n=1 Tax=Chitinimonas lacunae TaxID=1963018 RepID=A0ABV8MRA2_9NEIS
MKSVLIAAAAALLYASVPAAALPAPQPPEIAARAYLLVDFQSGATLAARDPDTRVEPASLTKLMTAYLTFKAVREGRLKLDQQLTVSEKGWKTEGSRMFLDPKKPATVAELIRGMIVQSGNDACITLAEAIAGSEATFAEMMNQEARRLGMKGSRYMNSTGLPHPDHYTTARDLAVLSGAIIREFPEFYPIYSLKEYRYNNITQPNRNLLLFRDPEVDGMKTGHTESAGFCLVATKRHQNRRVVSVLLGARSEKIRAEESAKLLGYGVQFFETPKLFTGGEALAKPQVYKGASDTVAVGFDSDRYVTLTRGQSGRLQKQIVLREPLIAPLAKGQQVGSVRVLLDGRPLLELPLTTLAAVPEAGWFGRSADAVKLWFR